MIQHLACIMDGNRRWATQQGLSSYLGHKQGVESVRNAIEFCLNNNISYLSLYTYSLENLLRPQSETDFVCSLIIFQSKKGMYDLIKHEVQVRFVGDKKKFPIAVIEACELIEQQTKHLTKLQLNFLFCYGAQQEIVSGVQEIAQKVKDGILEIKDISVEMFKKHLWLQDIPDPDLLIRTGDHCRLSNFMLFQVAYTEFYFTDCLWPDMSLDHFKRACDEFYSRQRKFGL